MKRLMYLAVILCAMALPAHSQLIINELMQSNIDCLYVDNEFPDSWAELYNTGSEAVALAGWRIGDKEDFDASYVLDTEMEIPAGGYALVYCDKDAYGLHTNFRIDSGKGNLYLFAPDGTLADGISYKKMPAPGIAYGRKKDGGDKWGHMICPTPNAKNAGGASEDLVPSPEFSAAPGFCNEEFVLTISIPETEEGLPEDVVLCVTTDGREPTIDNAVEGKSIDIAISKSTSVRAKLLSSEILCPLSTTRSYIFHEREITMPVVSITTDPAYLYDDVKGILVEGNSETPNYRNDWRRPVHIEYFDPESGEAQFSQLGETRVQGNYTRILAQKSLAVYANKRFGTKRFNTAGVWREKPELAECKSFILRNGGNDFEGGRLRDQFAQNLVGRNCPEADWQAYRPVICYINGEYAGIYDMRERSNEDYVDANYDGLEDMDMVENWYEVKSGSLDKLLSDLKAFNAEDADLQTYEERIDIDNFMAMYIINAFAANTDFPLNNVVCWRPWGDDARWRFIIKDVDRNGLRNCPVDYDYFSYIMSPNLDGGNNWATERCRMFRFFLEEEGKDVFLPRMLVALGDWLNPAYTLEVLDEMRNEIAVEYPAHAALYGLDLDRWSSSLDYLAGWYEERPDAIRSHMEATYGLTNPFKVEIPDATDVLVNDRPLSRPEFDGVWYADFALKLTSPEKGWKAEVETAEGETATYYIGKQEMAVGTDVVVPEGSKLTATPWDTTGIEDVVTGECNISYTVKGMTLTVAMGDDAAECEVYSMQGVLVARGGNGSYQLPGAGVYVLVVKDMNGNSTKFKILV